MRLGRVTTAPPDRRQRRRQQTIEELLDVAAAIMAEQGVAGLSLGEIARRVGIRPPSLYVYFPSKHAIYDALFARGARSLLAAMHEADRSGLAAASSLEDFLLEASGAFVRWSLQHPADSQLLFWRPVPGFTPSAEAYQPAVQLLDLTAERLSGLQRRGLLASTPPVEQLVRDWTVLVTGVISQQLSNAPDEDVDRGRFVQALPDLVAMFARYYAPPEPPPTRRRARHEESR